MHCRDLSYIFSSKSLQFWVRQDPRENRDKRRCLHKPARQLEDPTRAEREAFGNLRVLLCSGRKSSRDTFFTTLQGTSPATTPPAGQLPICRNFVGAASLSAARRACALAVGRANPASARRAAWFGSGVPGAGASSAFTWSSAAPSEDRASGAVGQEPAPPLPPARAEAESRLARPQDAPHGGPAGRGGRQHHGRGECRARGLAGCGCRPGCGTELANLMFSLFSPHQGGQILRVSTALSCLLGLPLRVQKIRAGRSTPGLR